MKDKKSTTSVTNSAIGLVFVKPKTLAQTTNQPPPPAAGAQPPLVAAAANAQTQQERTQAEADQLKKARLAAKGRLFDRDSKQALDNLQAIRTADEVDEDEMETECIDDFKNWCCCCCKCCCC